MVQTSKPLGGQRYRESFGRSYEDFVVGDVYEHRPGRTITQADNAWFTLLTMNTHPLHFDEEYARATEFGKCLVASPLTVAILVGMSVSDVSQIAIANLGWRGRLHVRAHDPGRQARPQRRRPHRLLTEARTWLPSLPHGRRAPRPGKRRRCSTRSSAGSKGKCARSPASSTRRTSIPSTSSSR